MLYSVYLLASCHALSAHACLSYTNLSDEEVTVLLFLSIQRTSGMLEGWGGLEKFDELSWENPLYKKEGSP